MFCMPLFTPDTARENAAKAHQARRRNEEVRAIAVAEPVTPPPEPPQVAAPLAETEVYVSNQLVYVRAHIARVDKLLEKETDALSLDRLARARNTLAEQERILAGRPLPGALRPGKPGKPARETDLEPI